MCTHDLCFEQKLEKYHNFSFKNYNFYSREILQYITWAYLRNATNAAKTEPLIGHRGGTADIHVRLCFSHYAKKEVFHILVSEFR